MFSIEDMIAGISGDKKKLIDVIYRAEVEAPEVGTGVISLLEHYNSRIKKHPKNKWIVKKLENIIRRLGRGQDRAVVYSDILPKDVVKFLLEAEKKSALPSMIFEKYAPIKAIGDKMLSKVKRKFYVPFLFYFIGYFAVGYIMSIFDEIRSDAVVEFGTLQTFILDHYDAISISLGSFFFVIFILIPHKLPMLKSIFAEINGMLALSSLEVYHYLSYGSNEMIKALRAQFNLKKNVPNKDIKGVVDLLEDVGFINDLQAAEILLKSDKDEIEKGIQRALDEKKDNIAAMGETVQDIVSQISILIIAPLVLMAVFVVIGMITATQQIL